MNGIDGKRCLTIALVIVSTVAAAGIAEAAPAPPPDTQNGFLQGEVIVRFKSGVSQSKKAALHAALGVQKTQPCGGAQLWTLGAKSSTKSVVEEHWNDPDLLYIQPNYIYHSFASPDDPLYPELWGLRNTGQTGGVPGADVDAERAWRILTGGQEIVVGVIDTGIDYDHEDLAANIWTNPQQIPCSAVNPDIPYAPGTHRGCDFFNNDSDAMDDHFHGTHVAGTIGAVGNNGVGLTGLNWNIRLVPLKFLGANGQGATCDAVHAVEYATLIGAHLTNNSWGRLACGLGETDYVLIEAIEAAGEAGMIFVAAAGNNAGSNDSACSAYPASYDLPNIVSVAATDHKDALAEFSNYGVSSVDLAAPGVAVLSSFPDNDYALLSGTSMATPHVVGALALIRALEPTISVAEWKQRLLDNVEVLPDLQGEVVTAGRLNAFRPIRQPDAVAPGPIDTLDAGQSTSSSVTLSWKATGDDDATGTASSYDVRYATSPILDEAAFAAATAVPVPFAPGPPTATETLVVTGLDAATAYHFAVRALDEWETGGPLGNSPSATTLGAPQVDPSPTSFAVTLSPGSTTTRPLTLQNEIPLTTLDLHGFEPDLSDPPEGVELGSPGGCSATCPSQTTASFLDPQYRVVDSDERGDPTFDWVDLTSHPAATVVSELIGHQQISSEIPIGFDFPFYGTVHSTAFVSTSGWISLGLPTFEGTGNSPLPSPQIRSNLIAGFWDDLDFAGQPRARYLADGDRFIVQYTDVPRGHGPGTYTFQIVLERSGTIAFNYRSMTGKVTSATIGIQDEGGGRGLLVDYHDASAHDDLQVMITPTPRWATASSLPATIHGGFSHQTTLQFDASGLPVGQYAGTFRIGTNDPSLAQVELPLDLNVSASGPDLVLGSQGVREGETLEVTSCLHIFGGATSHALALPWLPREDGRLELSVRGNYLFTTQKAVLSAEDIPLGAVTGITKPGQAGLPCPDCSARWFTLERPLLEFLLADDTLDLRVDDSANVDHDQCSIAQHTVRLRYEPSFDALDFEAVAAPQQTQQTLDIENGGQSTLHVVSIGTDSPAFTTSVASLTIPPGGSEPLTITHAPGSVASSTLQQANLTLKSDDVHESVQTVELVGVAGRPGATDIVPGKLSLSVGPGEKSAETFTVWNGTTSDRQYTISIAYGVGASDYLDVSPDSGTAAAGSGVPVGLFLDGSGLGPGLHTATIWVTLTKPAQTRQLRLTVLVR